ncbi:MAG TPA: chorismate-binding protein, partial [Herbaspirillum sp.]|nr:chorismate-binding protein [Herbaspirillum sp.]
MPFPCFALLDDNTAGAPSAHARSRLYTAYHATLTCHDGKALPATLRRMQAALQQGLHAVALCSYELGADLLGITPRVETGMALVEILLFSQCRHMNAAETAAWLQEQECRERAGHDSPSGIANVRASVDEARFTRDIARIRDDIAAGDTYQVNYTYRLYFDAYGAPAALYNKLRARQPVPYGAFIRLPDARCILSFSPELFVRHTQGCLHAQPMKGTAPASSDAQENARRAAALSHDEKNRAENLMIVDLLRNDLGQIAINGSVAVPHLFAVETFGQVLQMTSSVTARLRPDASLAEVFGALYPCGSITGAPKRRTMQIIRALENTPRGLYTGAIGWFDAAPPNRAVGDFCLSVPIRALILQPQQHGLRRGEMGVGAGIVHDSHAAGEYAECRLKAGFLTGPDSDGSDFSLFETLHATQADGCRYLDRHLQRLQGSATYFGFACDIAAIRTLFTAACAQLPPVIPHRLRLDLSRDGTLRLQHSALSPLPERSERIKVFVTAAVMDSDDLFLRHKSSVRARYDAAWKTAEQHGGFDMLFFNQRGELTEGGRSNVFVQLEGRWYTPPLAAGVLPGVMRAVLL